MISADQPAATPPAHRLARLADMGVTLACWGWFTLGFVLFFSWRYLWAVLVAADPQLAFQRLNCRFYRSFFRLVQLLAPRQRLAVDEEVAAIRSAVLVCNHLSYLDPLVLIATFERQRTIVKPRFFSVPIFGWFLARSGYLPASGEGSHAPLMVRQLETMGEYLADGGNLFVFPEGTRSRDGRIGELNQGALKIARLYRAPVYVLEIRNTDRLFAPGKFWFTSRHDNTIRLRVLDRIELDQQPKPPSAAELERRVRQAYLMRQQ